MKRKTLGLKSVILLFLLMVANSLQAGEIRISVAASMTDLFKDLISTFGENHTGVTVVPNFGPSGGLAKQINQGAPSDLYVSANPRWMTYLIEKKKIDVSSKKTFAHNALVFVGRPETSILSLSDLPTLELIGIASPKSVPAGQYAQQALKKTGLYDNLLQAGKLVMAKDVRQALIYADRGETGGSFVYKTDALLARNARVLFEVDQELYDKVTYPIAVTAMGADNPDAETFFHFVTSDAVKEIITKHGFVLPK
jgi:molybdate transport system substrate-binding protein